MDRKGITFLDPRHVKKNHPSNNFAWVPENQRPCETDSWKWA